MVFIKKLPSSTKGTNYKALYSNTRLDKLVEYKHSGFYVFAQFFSAKTFPQKVFVILLLMAIADDHA